MAHPLEARQDERVDGRPASSEGPRCRRPIGRRALRLMQEKAIRQAGRSCRRTGTDNRPTTVAGRAGGGDRPPTWRAQAARKRACASVSMPARRRSRVSSICPRLAGPCSRHVPIPVESTHVNGTCRIAPPSLASGTGPADLPHRPRDVRQRAAVPLAARHSCEPATDGQTERLWVKLGFISCAARRDRSRSCTANYGPRTGRPLRDLESGRRKRRVTEVTR